MKLLSSTLIALLLPNTIVSFNTSPNHARLSSITSATHFLSPAFVQYQPQRTPSSFQKRNFFHGHTISSSSSLHLSSSERIITQQLLLNDETTSPVPSNQPVPNQIPPLSSPGLSKLETEFYKMMLEFAEFTPKDIASVPDPRYRALYLGVLAGANEPQVMKAFAIVFSDLMPVRIAGRMIYRHLKGTMQQCIQTRNAMEQKLVDDHGLDIEAIDYGRKTFMAVMDISGEANVKDEAKLTMSALIDSGIVDTIVELLEFDSFDEFVEKMDADPNEKMTFEKYMVGLQKCTGGASTVKDTDDPTYCDVDVTCDLSLVLNEIVKKMEPHEAQKKEISVSERKSKYSDRYNNMVQSFEEWEDLVPSGDGRMVEVLRGCFAGAKNDDIVGALKIVYMDYSALRVGGDLVFKLMGKLVQRRQHKNS